MESPLTYVEIYLHVDGKRGLHSRLAIGKALAEVFEEIQGKRFDTYGISQRLETAKQVNMGRVVGLNKRKTVPDMQ